MSQERELIWVPKELAERFNSLETVEEQSALVMKFIEEQRSRIKASNEYLEDDVLEFKAYCLNYRKALSEVLNAQDPIMEALEEKTAYATNKMKEDLKKVEKLIEPIENRVSILLRKVDGIAAAMAKINHHQINQYISVVEQFANMSDDRIDLLRKLINSDK